MTKEELKKKIYELGKEHDSFVYKLEDLELSLSKEKIRTSIKERSLKKIVLSFFEYLDCIILSFENSPNPFEKFFRRFWLPLGILSVLLGIVFTGFEVLDFLNIDISFSGFWTISSSFFFIALMTWRSRFLFMFFICVFLTTARLYWL